MSSDNLHSQKRPFNYFTPSFGILSTYSSRDMSDNISNTGTLKQSEETVNNHESHEESLSDVLNDLSNSLRGVGSFVWTKLLGSKSYANGRYSDSQTTKEQNTRKRKELSQSFFISNKKRKIKGFCSDLSRVSISSSPFKESTISEEANGSDNTLSFLRDPFNWTNWNSESNKPATEKHRILTQNYGSTLFRRHRLRTLRPTVRNDSDQISYLKDVFNGEYKVPEILRDEKLNQLELLEKDKLGNAGIKKTIFHLTEKIKEALSKDIKPLSDDDLFIINERKVNPLEKKRKDFYDRYLDFNKSLFAFENDFRSYKELLDERKRIQSEIKEKRDKFIQKKLIPELTKEDIIFVQKALQRNDNSIISKQTNLDITVRDFKTLAPRRWLNDTIIEYFMQEIEGMAPKTVAFNSFFYTSLSERGYQGVRRWMKRKKMTITDLDRIFVPINLNQSHWALGMIDIPRKRIIYVDSLSHGPNAMSFAILSDLQKYVIEESKHSIGEDFELSHVDCPQQPNGFDCGIYVCMNTLYLSQNSALTFTSEDATRMRTYISHLILTSSSNK